MTRKDFQLLVKRHLDGEVTPQEKAFLEKYYNHFDNEADLILSEEEFLETEALIFKSIQNEENSLSETSIRKIKWLRIAAIWLIVTGTLGVGYAKRTWVLDTINPVKQIVKTAQKGNVLKVRLTDGTEVWLNGGTSITYPETFRYMTREVYLSGEAFFEVKPDKEKPFIVHSGLIKTQVIGTSFNISCYQKTNNIKVSVTEGKVGVTSSQATKSKQVFVLLPNQQINYNKTDGFSSIKILDTKNTISWRSGNYNFKEATLEEVALALENRYNIIIDIKRDELKKKVVTAGFESSDSLKTIMDAFKETLNLNYKFINSNSIEWY